MPNHAINLWQYFGQSYESVGKLMAADRTQFGLTNAQISAFAVLVGPTTDLFCRLAGRAGSLIPEVVNAEITVEVASKFVEQAPIAKPIFSSNQNPLAKWLNLILVATATYHPGRFRTETLAVDPFVASLTAIEVILSDRVG